MGKIRFLLSFPITRIKARSRKFPSESLEKKTFLILLTIKIFVVSNNSNRYKNTYFFLDLLASIDCNQTFQSKIFSVQGKNIGQKKLLEAIKTVSKEKSANMSNTDGLTGFTSMPQF